MLAVSTGVAIVYGVLIFAVLLTPAVITALKGKWLLFAAGWLTIGMVWFIAMFLPAAPGSWWDRRRHPS